MLPFCNYRLSLENVRVIPNWYHTLNFVVLFPCRRRFPVSSECRVCSDSIYLLFTLRHFSIYSIAILIEYRSVFLDVLE